MASSSPGRRFVRHHYIQQSPGRHRHFFIAHHHNHHHPHRLAVNCPTSSTDHRSHSLSTIHHHPHRHRLQPSTPPAVGLTISPLFRFRWLLRRRFTSSSFSSLTSHHRPIVNSLPSPFLVADFFISFLLLSGSTVAHHHRLTLAISQPSTRHPLLVSHHRPSSPRSLRTSSHFQHFINWPPAPPIYRQPSHMLSLSNKSFTSNRQPPSTAIELIKSSIITNPLHHHHHRPPSTALTTVFHHYSFVTGNHRFQSFLPPRHSTRTITD